MSQTNEAIKREEGLGHVFNMDNAAELQSRLDEGLSVNHLIKGGAPLLALAAAYEAPKLKTARLLLLRGAKVNKPDLNGSTPLHHAARKGHHSLVELYSQAGADATIRNNLGHTPLDEACSYPGREQAIKALLLAHPNLDVSDYALVMSVMNNQLLNLVMFDEGGVDLTRVIQLPIFIPQDENKKPVLLSEGKQSPSSEGCVLQSYTLATLAERVGANHIARYLARKLELARVAAEKHSPTSLPRTSSPTTTLKFSVEEVQSQRVLLPKPKSIIVSPRKLRDRANTLQLEALAVPLLSRRP